MLGSEPIAFNKQLQEFQKKSGSNNKISPCSEIQICPGQWQHQIYFAFAILSVSGYTRVSFAWPGLQACLKGFLVERSLTTDPL
jgi:hypothetical protein